MTMRVWVWIFISNKTLQKHNSTGLPTNSLFCSIFHFFKLLSLFEPVGKLFPLVFLTLLPSTLLSTNLLCVQLYLQICPTEDFPFNNNFQLGPFFLRLSVLSFSRKLPFSRKEALHPFYHSIQFSFQFKRDQKLKNSGNIIFLWSNKSLQKNSLIK